MGMCIETNYNTRVTIRVGVNQVDDYKRWKDNDVYIHLPDGLYWIAGVYPEKRQVESSSYIDVVLQKFEQVSYY